MRQSSRRPVIVLALSSLALAGATAPDAEVRAVEHVDLERYSGKWFEVGRLPNRFQKDCTGATAEYWLRDDGDVGVLNTCYQEDGETRTIEGKARRSDESSNAKLKVQFNGFWFKLFSWLIKANYWVLYLPEDYGYVVVGTPDHDYLWILSRTRTLSDDSYAYAVERANAQGFEVERLIRTEVPAGAVKGESDAQHRGQQR